MGSDPKEAETPEYTIEIFTADGALLSKKTSCGSGMDRRDAGTGSRRRKCQTKDLKLKRREMMEVV